MNRESHLKRTEIGLIPEGWNVQEFSMVLDGSLRNGLTKPTSVRGKGVKMVNMGELFDNDRIKNVEMERVPLSEPERKAYLLQSSDLLFARQSLMLSGVGKCSIFLEDAEDVTFEGHLIRARIDTKKANPAFYYYFFRSRIGRNIIESYAEQVAAAGIRGSDLRRIPVPVPPKREQAAIAVILSNLDSRVETIQEVNKALKEIGQAVFKRWFVDFEFPNEEGKPYKSSGGEMVESELGKIPKGWSTLNNISELCTRINYGYTQSSRTEEVGPKFLRVMDINKNDWIDWTSVPYCEIEEKDVPKYLLKKNDIVIARMADPGKVAIFESDFPAIFASYLIRIRLKDPRFAYYLYYLMKSSYYQDFIEGATTGSVQMNLNAKSLTTGLSLALPGKELIYAFGSITENLRTKINHNVLESNSLTKIRDALLPKLMSGKIRVAVTEEKVGAS